eukprot:CAMPEP_0119547706 /NCGR_PEP_ID=MMETSP1352-20130426/1767_1 /TAXON_ID=265584 /ORGANISM="Stauroneis constricta, Strain CCMP1120" /LENGTH=136 /DNA_ID=CAMNT_0007592709 /DNA_START=117 /DNA_END=527 /DNA_ORIENTATION=-
MMDDMIPVMNKPANLMENGPNGDNLEQMAMIRHPVQEMQRQRVTNRNSFLGTIGEQEVRRLYGSGLAMRLATERKMGMEQGTRGVVGLPSSGLMADILSGDDTKINFEDFLGLPDNRPTQARADNPHSAMERKLGM